MSAAPTPALTLASIREAHARIRDMITRTLVLTNETLDLHAEAQLFFKCENLQKAGAFKARGATNAVFSLSEEEVSKGVVTHSSGNHAAALARAAKLRDVPAFIVMPKNAPTAKQAAARCYGAEILFCEPTLQARETVAAHVVKRTGGTLVHPYDDLRVMTGQGTAALEFLEDVPDLDLILCPVGGGGLLSGTAVAAKALRPSISVIGVEPVAADDAYRSFRAGHIIRCADPRTIADGLRTSLGIKPFGEIMANVSDIVTVTEAAIIKAMRLLWETTKLIVEPSGAVPYAALLEGKLDVVGKRVGVILSGGNLDLDRLPWAE